MDHKEEISKLLTEGTVTALDLAKIINDYVRLNVSCDTKGYDILNALDGWTIDDEMAISWGVQRLMQRIGDEKGALIAFEVLYHAREARLKEVREKVLKEIKIDNHDRPDICAHMCNWCTQVEGCTGTMEEWTVGETKKGGTCIMQVDPEAYQCPQCSKGILNTTFNGTFACDKCAFEVNYNYFKANKEIIYK